MTGTLYFLIALALALWLWSNARAAAERAQALAFEACRRAGVQLLDQTVALESLRLRRDDEGRVRLLRRFRYEYSRYGDDRHRASLALLGERVAWMQAPEAQG